jgi:thiol-disulfide isomerase/thioredoxin
MKKKILAAILAAAALTLLLASCGAAQNTQGQDAAQPFASFTATDLEGNQVDQTVFSGHKLTMINVWGTFCSPCIGEMPELGELSAEYADKGLQIVGIPVDISYQGNDTEKIQKAKNIAANTGANYTHILPSESLYNAVLKDVYSVPTTYFVDENGHLVGESYLGARDKSEWAAIIDNLLESVK